MLPYSAANIKPAVIRARVVRIVRIINVWRFIIHLLELNCYEFVPRGLQPVDGILPANVKRIKKLI
jgi:hypothetical protein